jgi:tripartite-type tricarboxylate transporter receptor subunit TctC
MMRSGLALLIVLSSVVGAQAQPSDGAAWPNRPVRLIVPFPAGSGTDVPARIIAQKLGERLGQQIVVDNRAGASGAIGSEAIARAAPDGYTIGLITASTHALAPSLNKKLPYDSIKDFVPVGMVGGTPYVLVAYPGLGAKSLKDLIALAKSKPGKLNYGSAGPASLAHLAGALFANLAQIDITHVPYRASAQSVTDMIGGRLEMQFATVAPMLSNIRSGKVAALAVTGPARIVALPNVPTMIEAGVPGYEAFLWMAIVAPVGTPPDIVTRLNRELNAVLTGDAKKSLDEQGMQLETGSPEQVTARIRRDTDKWRDVAAKAKILAE